MKAVLDGNIEAYFLCKSALVVVLQPSRATGPLELWKGE